ncbi:penicillin acylase family protein [Flavobacterium lipolyticum]|uniref:Penicillin acylase family protein n=1 Tax=Flavobacterium lipolyticum TaxID=2893754 RepID=A0ABS8M402_9FLAO|nr:penicillin acylase family protein [Flavobacterium sp. F-126]MCC9019512.1 penicillin acylase family protein [Flavobacterium sp. F-126]
MNKISVKFLFPLVALIMLVVVLDRKVYMVPPLGTFLNPFIGAVQNEQTSNSNKDISIKVSQKTEIIFDDRAVPHIFAANQKDMFFAQGYVCASDRLWQMDFLSYVSAGRMCEILGKEFFVHDRKTRRDGILTSAINTLKHIEKDQETKRALDSYTAGVNAWINSLSYADLPIEYKLMDYSPEPWTNLKSVLIMKYMSANLSGFEEDVSASYLQMILGSKEYNKLFPDYYLKKTKEKFAIQRIFDSLPENEYIDYSFLASASQISSSAYNPNLGSNSWAVGPKKSKSGFAMLCNDPHLNLSFPAVWYELQLKSNEQNVYGYSIPGVPGVVIGFNEKISWGLTNGSDDVRDYYKLEVKDNYSYYKYDGKWVKTDSVVEEIKIRGDKPFLDTVYYTKHGPIPSDFREGEPELEGYALNWTLQDPSNEILALIKLNKATKYTQFKSAIQYYKCPSQNFTYADVEGNISIHHQGKILAKKWKNQGKFVMDGTRSDQFSTAVLDKLPYSYNPDQGYVFSANNNPYKISNSPLIYGHYLELRANKIDSYLSAKEKLSVEDMKSMQLDNTNSLAELAIPVLLKRMPSGKNKYLKEFSLWNCKYDKDSNLAPLFELWWTKIKNNTWDELLRYKMTKLVPDDLVLLDMISNDPNNKYFDLLSTEKTETASDIIALSFNQMLNDTTKRSNWGNTNKIDIMHLSNIEYFSKKGLPQGGHPQALNAISKRWGPSLRMIVEMKKRPKGYAVYAGGQSGNPSSDEYDHFVDTWRNGQYYELKFFGNLIEGNAEAKYKWSLK